MGILHIATNEVAFGIGHLQFVYEANNVIVELEVQAPDDNGVFGGDWNYVGVLGDRAHFGPENTPGTTADGTIADQDEYAIVQIAAGVVADQYWELLLEIAASMQTNAATLDYDTNLLGGEAQNSNSFVGSLAWAIGIDLDPVLQQLSDAAADITA